MSTKKKKKKKTKLSLKAHRGLQQSLVFFSCSSCSFGFSSSGGPFSSFASLKYPCNLFGCAGSFSFFVQQLKPRVSLLPPRLLPLIQSNSLNLEVGRIQMNFPMPRLSDRRGPFSYNSLSVNTKTSVVNTNVGLVPL